MAAKKKAEPVGNLNSRDLSQVAAAQAPEAKPAKPRKRQAGSKLQYSEKSVATSAIEKAYNRFYSENSGRLAAKGAKLATFEELTGKNRYSGRRDNSNLGAWATTQTGQHYMNLTRQREELAPSEDAPAENAAIKRVGYQEGVQKNQKNSLKPEMGSEQYKHHADLQALGDKLMELHDQSGVMQHGHTPVEEAHGNMLQALGDSAHAHSMGYAAEASAHFNTAVNHFRRMARAGAQLGFIKDHQGAEAAAKQIHENYKTTIGQN
jgi:hypothetical protein